MQPQEIREIRWLVRRIFLGRFSGKLKNKIYAELIRRGIKYDVKKIFTSNGKGWLKSLSVPAINSYLLTLNSIEQEMKKLALEIAEVSKRYEEVRIIDSIPGIAKHGALIVFSIIGEIDRFSNGEKFYSYACLIPRVN